MRISAKHVALIVAFAALHAFLSLLPFTITIGMSGQITLGVIGGPLIGILLGPVIGGVAVLIGSFIGVFLNPAGAIFGFLTVIPPTLGAVSAGCIRDNKSYVAGILATLWILVFYAHPAGRGAYLYPFLHIIAAAIAFSLLAYPIGSIFMSLKLSKTKLTCGVALAAFISVLVDNIAGSAIAIWYFSPYLTAEFWETIIYVYPLERVAATVLTVLIVTPVYYSLVKAGFIELMK